MYGIHKWEPAISLALLVLSCTVALSAETKRRATQSGKEDETVLMAERITREGLLSGMAGAAETRNAALRRALSTAPDYALAHWHLGQLRVDDEWLTIAQAEERMSADAQLNEYRELRAAAGIPRRELGLARWCRRQGIPDTERLHLRRVLENDSSEPIERKQAADRLGLREYRGALLPETEIKQLEAESAKQRKNQAKWSPLVEKWRTLIENGSASKRSHARQRLRAVKDPAAISTLEVLLSPRSEQFAMEVVTILGNMPEYEATESLARHAVAPWDSVRDAVVQQLERRPLHDFAPLLLRQLVAPVQSRFYVNVGLDGLVRHQHELFREGPQASHLLSGSYIGGPVAVRRNKIIRGALTSGPRGRAGREELAKTQEEQARQQLAAAAVRSMVLKQESARALQIERDVANANAAIAQKNGRTFEVLERTSGEMLTRSPTAWWDWWQDYNEIYREGKPTFTYQVGRVDPHYIPYSTVTLHSCFPAGTQVRGETGLIAIEHVQPGDRVLSQDVETGELAYKLVIQTTERPPSDLLRIGIGNATIATTKGHPFWVNNVGWHMAKRLEIGQQLHGAAGGQTIDHIEPAASAKAYNLVVADFGTYFVGDPGVLVHDNTYRKPTMAVTPGLLAGHADEIDDKTL